MIRKKRKYKLVEGELDQFEEELENQPEQLKEKLKDKEINRLVDEYYALDFEDTIGELKTKFKYTQVDRDGYGLTEDDILYADDKLLNQFVSLKKIAPYKVGQKQLKLNKNQLQNIQKNTKQNQVLFINYFQGPA